MTLEVVPVTSARAPDAEALFSSANETAGCFCTWFIIPVVQYHAGGVAQNRQLFRDLVASGDAPVGLLAYRDGTAVGWCAAGPRSRFARALKIPSFKGRDPAEDDDVWLVPCFFVRREERRAGVSTALLRGAVELAREHGAAAIEGFPFASGAKPSRESMVGMQAIFDACGFEVARRPSATRVVMRKNL